METRYNKVDLRQAATDENKVVGYASVFNSWTELTDMAGRTFKEVIRPGAFSRTLEANTDVVALFNHSPDSLLGRTASKTLSLKQDERGLYFEVDLPDTSLGHDIKQLVKRGDLQGASFAFIPQKERWTHGAVPTRELLDLDLHDISVVVSPAYKKTSLDLRSVNFPKGELYKFKLTLRLLEVHD